MLPSPQAPHRPVPWRTIWATIFSVLITGAAINVLQHITRIITWLAVALFFAVILSPSVDFLVRRLRFKRALAILLVFIVGLGLFSAMMYAFIRPLVDQAQEVSERFPQYLEDARNGEGPAGRLVKRYELDRRFDENRERIEQSVEGLGSNSLNILRGVGNAVAAGLTIFVLAFLMILEGPRMLAGAATALAPPTRERVKHVAADCAKAVTGYMYGNLLISLIAGVSTFVFLLIVGVPFRAVLALWVAFADLIPLVGATLGAIPAVGVAFLHSVPAGIATLIFFIAYQQFENHVLQVTVMSRTVNLNPLVVLVSVLIGVEMFGILGALLAIPVAGVIQVIARDIWDERTGRLKEEPTVGEDEIPVSQVAGEAAEEAEGE